MDCSLFTKANLEEQISEKQSQTRAKLWAFNFDRKRGGVYEEEMHLFQPHLYETKKLSCFHFTTSEA